MTASKDSAYATGKNVCLYLFLGPLEGKLWVHSKWANGRANGSIVGETKLKLLQISYKPNNTLKCNHNLGFQRR